nr:hypothetical protein [Candidatus Freyarchaeota archaeon]
MTGELTESEAKPELPSPLIKQLQPEPILKICPMCGVVLVGYHKL